MGLEIPARRFPEDVFSTNFVNPLTIYRGLWQEAPETFFRLSRGFGPGGPERPL